MEVKEVQATSGLDDCIPPPVSFWQKTGLRVIVTVALFGPAAAVFVSQYLPARHQVVQSATKMRTPSEYGIETPDATADARPSRTVPITVDVIANPPSSVSDRPGGLQLMTKPAGASFAVYSGIIAEKTPPSSPPLRSGTSPGTVEDLRSGNYTIFFHKEGWPDSRTEVQVQAGEVLPVAYAFPHGEVTISSEPNGAEILAGTSSLGFTPLTIDLPPGRQELTARLKNYPERTQTVTVSDNSKREVNFQMRTRRHVARARPTPTPSLMDRLGGSLKHLFGGDSTPPARKTR